MSPPPARYRYGCLRVDSQGPGQRRNGRLVCRCHEIIAKARDLGLRGRHLLGLLRQGLSEPVERLTSLQDLALQPGEVSPRQAPDFLQLLQRRGMRVALLQAVPGVLQLRHLVLQGSYPGLARP